MFGHYGVFAALPLNTVQAEADINVRTAFTPSKIMPIKNIPSFGHSDYFTFEELAFLSTISSDTRPRSAEQIELDKRVISRELTEIGKICKLHAEYLLKAITFWEMYYEEKYTEWIEKFLEAHKARIARIRLVNRCPEGDEEFEDDDDGMDWGTNEQISNMEELLEEEWLEEEQDWEIPDGELDDFGVMRTEFWAREEFLDENTLEEELEEEEEEELEEGEEEESEEE